MPAKLYDWNRWFAKGRFKLVRGRDYHCGQVAMAQQIRNASHLRGLHVSVMDTDTGFTVEVKEVASAPRA